ncbi:MAG: hypothetical protein EB830_06820 [Nitrosopumilus sp. H13]|nr:MAG: hypothetical protein EB830_06820 [Nitrosopumilus sp. H13]
MERLETDFADIQELIQFTFTEFAKTGILDMTENQILGVLYLVKTDLPDDDPLKQKLAYYWHVSGPSSDVVCSALDQMISKTILQTQGLYRLSDTCKQSTHNGSMSNALNLVAKHVSAFTNPDDMIRNVYKHSPFLFYTAYKLNFKKKFEDYCSHILGNDKYTCSLDEVLVLFRTATLALRAEDGFSDFEMIYNKYSRALYILLETDPSFDEHIEKDFDLARELCNEIWITFAHQVRIHAHDPYYERLINDWRAQSDSKTSNLKDMVDKFSDSVSRLPMPEKRLYRETEETINDIDQGKTKSDSYPATNISK